MPNLIIPPRDLPPANEVYPSDALVVDNGASVSKATAQQVVDAGRPWATIQDAQDGTASGVSMSPLTTAAAIQAQTSSAINNATAGVRPYASYEQALAVAPNVPAETLSISAVVNEIETRWIRNPAGTALGGGWSPADTPTPRHYAMAAASVGSALSRALNVDGDRSVDLGSGTYILDGETVEALHPFTLRGNGPGKTTLICRNMTNRNGLNVTLTGPYNGGASKLEGMSIILEGGNGGTFLVTPKGNAARSFLAKYEVENVRFHGGNGQSFPSTSQFAWATALQLGDGDHHIVRNCEYYGRYNPTLAPTADNAFGTFLRLGGVGSEGGLGYPVVEDCRVLYAGRGVGFDGGILARPKFDKLSIHDCWEGVISDIPLSGSTPEEITFVDCDVNTQRRSIHIEATSQIVAVATDTTRAPNRFDHGQPWTGWYVGFGGAVRLTDCAARDLVPSSGTPYTSTHTGFDIGGDDISINGRVRTSGNGRFQAGLRLRSPAAAEVVMSMSSSGTIVNGVSVEGTAPATATVQVDLKSIGNLTNRLVMSGGYSRSNVVEVGAVIGVDANRVSYNGPQVVDLNPSEGLVKRVGTGGGPTSAYTIDFRATLTGAQRNDVMWINLQIGGQYATARILDNTGAVLLTIPPSGVGVIRVYAIQLRRVGTSGVWRTISANESLA